MRDGGHGLFTCLARLAGVLLAPLGAGRSCRTRLPADRVRAGWCRWRCLAESPFDALVRASASDPARSAWPGGCRWAAAGRRGAWRRVARLAGCRWASCWPGLAWPHPHAVVQKSRPGGAGLVWLGLLAELAPGRCVAGSGWCRASGWLVPSRAIRAYHAAIAALARPGRCQWPGKPEMADPGPVAVICGPGWPGPGPRWRARFGLAGGGFAAAIRAGRARLWGIATDCHAAWRSPGRYPRWRAAWRCR